MIAILTCFCPLIPLAVYVLAVEVLDTATDYCREVAL